jgi:integrase/recombinase XerD
MDGAVETNGLGFQFERFKQDKMIQRVAKKTLEVYDNAWKFFGPSLEKLDLSMLMAYRDEEEFPTNLAPGAQVTAKRFLKYEEQRIVDAIKSTIRERQIGSRPVSPVTINVYLRVMNTLLRWLKHEAQFLTYDWRVKPLEEPKGERRQIFTEDEVQRLIRFRPKSFNQTRAWTIAMTMLDTGIRIDEALSLEERHVTFDSDIIFVEDGKGEKSRYVPVSEILRPILYRYITRTKPKNTALVFGTHKDTKMSQRNALRDIHVVERAADVRPLSWHCYRHTMATGYSITMRLSG